MNKKPFFSIIIPTFNRSKMLKIAIDSVLQQSFKDFELIIIDDGSTDNTKELIKNFAKRYPLNAIRYFHQKNQGVAIARNKGIKKSLGKYIVFLDSDDRLCAHKLEITHEYIKKFKKIKIFHTDEIWYRNGKLLSQKKYQAKPEGWAFEESLKTCCIAMSTVCIKKELFKTIGFFDKKLMVCEDYDLWLRITANFQVKLIPKALTIKQGGHTDQLSKKFKSMDTFRIYAIEKILKNTKIKKEQKMIAFNELKIKCNIYVKGTIKRQNEKEARKYKNKIEKYRKKLCGKV